jgi:hypothetical protein
MQERVKNKATQKTVTTVGIIAGVVSMGLGFLSIALYAVSVLACFSFDIQNQKI